MHDTEPLESMPLWWRLWIRHLFVHGEQFERLGRRRDLAVIAADVQLAIEKRERKNAKRLYAQSLRDLRRLMQTVPPWEHAA